jgi:zinc transporter 9
MLAGVAACKLGTGDMEGALMGAGRDMVGALGAEVDRLETEIQRVMPSIRHIDLVRTRSGSYPIN